MFGQKEVEGRGTSGVCLGG
jgi:hypothetical protein